MAAPNATASKHELKQSGLYRLRKMSDLAKLFHWKKTHSALRALCHSPDNWNEFEQKCEGKEPRPIQEPKPAAKAIQHRLNELLKRIIPPDYLHSGTRGRSYLSNSGEHMAQSGATVTVDISKFYPSVSRKRIFMLFREEFECAPDIADALANLMSCNGHLATGSPASALMSFWACKDMFDGIARRAEKLGGKFTLYVDDITLTADTGGRGDVHFLERHFASYGFKISAPKSRVYRADQAKQITGRVVRNGVSRAPNKQHRKMHDAALLVAEGDASIKDKRSAIGILQHVGQLDAERKPKLMAQARRIRATLSSGKT